MVVQIGTLTSAPPSLVGSTPQRGLLARQVLEACPGPSVGPVTQAMSRDAQEATVALVRALSPTRILELGSGASTVALARAIVDAPHARVWSLEHSTEYLEITRRALAAEGLESRVELVLAPLRTVRVGAFVGRWYDPSTLPAGVKFDFVVIDGPPSRKSGRFMTLPALWPHLADQAVLVLDDAKRAKFEGVWIDLWRRIYGPRLDVIVYHHFQKGLALMVKSDGPVESVSASVWARYALNRIAQALRIVRHDVFARR